jgi:hypothetical protein
MLGLPGVPRPMLDLPRAQPTRTVLLDRSDQSMYYSNFNLINTSVSSVSSLISSSLDFSTAISLPI